MKIDWKKRFSNKTFLISFSSAIILLLQQLGLGDFIPANMLEIINTVLLILTMLGVVIDPATPGLGDKQNEE
jgi:phi LC3 family holin